MNAQLLNAPMVSGFDAMQADRAPQLQQTPRPLAPVGAQAVDRDGAGGRLSSDAGLVLLKDIAAPLGFTRHLAAVLSDSRAPRRVTLTQPARRTPRVLPMAAGDEDANDSHTLRAAPLFTLLLDRLPATGAPLASPPTLSRCEHCVARRALSRRARVWLEQWLAAYATPPTVSVRAVDAPAARVQGHQAQARDDGYEGG